MLVPVYEYICKKCGQPFEELVLGDESVACPSCKSHELEKRFSVFATNHEPSPSADTPGPGACGTCGDPRGPGACSLN